MNRKEQIQGAYKSLGSEATFYDGMITCTTLINYSVANTDTR